jgi:3-hydroxyisobutyrate dehydrogenase
MKLVLNYVMGTTLAGLAEGMALAEKIGLNTAEMLNILSHTPVSSPFLRTKGTGAVHLLLYVTVMCMSAWHLCIS